MRILATVCAVLAFAPAAWGQAAKDSSRDLWAAKIKTIVDAQANAPANKRDVIKRAVSVFTQPVPFLLYAHERNQAPDLRTVEDARTDKQIGGPPAAGTGSTSLVSRGGVPAILSFAVEQGAATQTTDGTAVTIRGNAVGWLDLLQGQGFIQSYQDDAKATRALRALSYSFTFDTPGQAPASAERPDDAEVEAQAKAADRQLVGYSVRAALIDQRDPRRPENRASVAKVMRGSSLALSHSIGAFDRFFVSDAYQAWIDETVVELNRPMALSAEQVEQILYARLEVLRLRMAADIPEFAGLVAGAVTALEGFEQSRTDVLKMLQDRFVLAAELVRSRPANQPASWTGRVIGEGRPGNTRLDLTFNFAVTYQDDDVVMTPTPTTKGGWRDLQIGLSAEMPYGKEPPCPQRAGTLGRPIVSFEYLSRLLSDKAVVTFAGHDFEVEKGWIHAAQAKVTIPVKGSGMKVPISVSFANRSELIKEKQVRAHIGVTFDFDTLFAAVRR